MRMLPVKFRRSLIDYLGQGLSSTSYKQIPPAQTRESWDSPFSTYFSNYQPLKHNLDLYEVLREAISILDVAVQKLVRLVGSFRIDALGKESVQKMLDEFMQKVRVNWFGYGFHNWLSQITDSTLSKGMGFGEVVPLLSMTDIHRLKVARANNMRFITKDGHVILGQVDKNNITPEPIKNQDYVHYVAFDQRDGHPQGYSLFHSLPFVSQIFVRIQKSIDNQIWRFGDPSLVVIVKGDKEGKLSDKTVAQLTSGWQTDLTTVMQARRKGRVQDMGMGIPNGGDIEIKVLAGDNEIVNIEVPTHTVLEQIVSRIHLPPSILGLYKWTSRESMATHQVDMLVSMINSFRENWNPIIEKVIDTKLILSGNAGTQYKWEWNDVNLKDEVEQARSNQLNASAREKDINILEKLINLGLISEIEEIDQYLEDHGIKQLEKTDEYVQRRIKSVQNRLKYFQAGNVLKSVYNIDSLVPTNGNSKVKERSEELVI